MFSKNGSIPKTETDGTEGWVEVPDAPEVPQGKEVAWLNGEWVVRDPKPDDRPGYQWNWAHEAQSWVECEYPATAPEAPVEPPAVPIDVVTPSASATVDSAFISTSSVTV